MPGYVEYDSNNSGGSWWLKDADWKNLEAAGWIVLWAGLSNKFDDEGAYVRDAETGVPVIVPVEQSNSKFSGFMVRDGRYLGALAKTAYRVGLDLREAADEWERITGQSATEAGCSCCGQPHNFREYSTAGKFIASGPDIEFVPSASWA